MEIRSGPGPADGKNPRLLAERGHIVDGRRHRDVRVRFQIAIFDDNVFDWIAIRAIEAVAPIVEAEAELAIARDGFAFAGEWVKAKIHAADVDRLRFAE